ncbi:hypothetical protein [Thiocapsa roseopersicina]|uniref:Uncharacterized protein n=1 Tax=Thiocapsa roseopersicina TaxID=1058 RepID=A0A1H3A6C8_THIRO|nr:hypothetical protein [Thiocapsa roseopersicina]SDX25267.1 hypothetical protein SAMN05421783_11891 [Thiocapsa roseopersicina]
MSTSVPDGAGPAGAGLERFVRGTLGCTCPDAVFERIEVREGPSLPAGGRARRITIGGRLLIYLVEGVSVEHVNRDIQAWTLSGRIDRDGANMNRFRLVIGLDGLSTTDAGEIERAFAAASDEGDDRMHLHVVESDSIRALHL